MTSLSQLFSPRSVAVVGASDQPDKIGGRVFRYLKSSGFGGVIHPVNHRLEHIEGLRCSPSVSELPSRVDTALLAVPSTAVRPVLEECVAMGISTAIVFGAGYAEAGSAGEAEQRQLEAIVAGSGTRVLGPNCLGVINFSSRYVGTFSPVVEFFSLRAGNVALVSQSGAFASYCYSAAVARGIRFSHWITTGNEMDIDVAECVQYLAGVDEVGVIALYMEGCRDGNRLCAALEQAQRNGKIVVALKSGTSSAGARAAQSHTAALVGSDESFSAVFRRYGVQRAKSMADFVDSIAVASQQIRPSNRGIGILTTSGGAGIMMADAAAELGLDLPSPSQQTQAALKAMVPYAATLNPVDVTGQHLSDPSLWGKFLFALLEEEKFGTIVAYMGHRGYSPALQPLLPVLREARRRAPDKLLISCMIGTAESICQVADTGWAVIQDPNAAITAAASLMGRASGSPVPGMELTSIPLPSDLGDAPDETDALRLLRDAGISVIASERVSTIDDAVELVGRIGYPLVAKIASPKIPHKARVGGVVLDIRDEAALRKAWDELSQVHARVIPDDPLRVALSPYSPGGIETFVGLSNDELFGSMLAFGTGGTDVEGVRDVTVELCPMDEEAARAAIARTRVWQRITSRAGGDRSRFDIDELVATLVRISQLGVAWREGIETLDVNPIVVKEAGVMALDALIVPRTRG